MTGLFWRFFAVLAVVIVVAVVVADAIIGWLSPASAVVENLIMIITLLAAVAAGLWWLVQVVVVQRLVMLEQAIVGLSNDQIDLTQPIAETGNDELSTVIRCYNSALSSFDKAMINIKSSVVRLRPMSLELADTTMGLSQKNQLQFNQSTLVGEELDSLNQAANHMNTQADEIVTATESSSEAISNGQSVVNGAYQGINQLADTIEQSMNDADELQTASVKIAETIGVIHSIAEATNLLALNAAIEAARAGEAGRGFSVVADEVRNLSDKTQQSTRQIEVMVAEIQKATTSVVEAMRQGQAAAKSSVAQMADAKDNFVLVFNNTENISQSAASIAEAIHHQVDSLLKVTGINHEMNELNSDILAFSKQNGLSEVDLIKLSECILTHISHYQLSQTQFDEDVRPKGGAHAPAASNDNEIELF